MSLVEIFPMLAQPHKTVHPDINECLRVLNNGEWLFDIKWDGIRCMAHVEGGVVTLINRRSVDITFRYPEIVATLSAAYPEGHRVFDGEIVCFTPDEDGVLQPDFPATHRRDAQQSATAAARLLATSPATYVAFDFLHFGGDDLRGLPYKARRTLLDVEASSVFEDYDLLNLSYGTTDAATMYDFVVTNNLEGLIAKRLSSQYVAGRSGAWVKIKPTRRVSALVTGYDPGEGWRASTFGALHLALLDDGGELQAIGKVGTGFKQTDLDIVLNLMQSGQPLVVEVEYQEVSPNGQLRFPSYKGVRTDVELLDCTTSQLA